MVGTRTWKIKDQRTTAVSATKYFHHMNGKRAKTKDNIDHDIPLTETLCKYLRVINDQRDSPAMSKRNDTIQNPLHPSIFIFHYIFNLSAA